MNIKLLSGKELNTDVLNDNYALAIERAEEIRLKFQEMNVPFCLCILPQGTDRKFVSYSMGEEENKSVNASKLLHGIINFYETIYQKRIITTFEDLEKPNDQS